jgi:hypothetical protein
MRKQNRSIASGFLFTFLALTLVLSFSQTAAAQKIEKDLLIRLMEEQGSDFQHILSDPERYRVQILYTQIDRNESNEPSFKSYSFGVSPDTYFYPASSVKIFGAALSLEKFKKLNIKGLNKDTFVRIDSSHSGQSTAVSDSTSASGKPSFRHYIKKLLVLSDNDAYNRTYEFLGQEALNESLRSKGYDKLRLTHRLSISLSPEENRNTNAMSFYGNDPDSPIYRQEAMASSKDYSAKSAILLGDSYVTANSIIEGPMDFSKKNYCSLEELQKAIKSLIFPNTMDPKDRFDLSAEDLRFLRTYMSQLPRETEYPDYSDKPDNYCKFFIYGDDNSASIPDHIRIFNKIGLAYGFCIDNAYIVDFKENIEFMLTAVIYANENNTLNDGVYEYETVAFPFLAELGRIIYNYELKRSRTFPPDLSEFNMSYDISGSSNE